MLLELIIENIGLFDAMIINYILYIYSINLYLTYLSTFFIIFKIIYYYVRFYFNQKNFINNGIFMKKEIKIK